MTTDVVACPKCGSSIPVSKLITEQIRGDMERDFSARLRAEQAKLRDQIDEKLRQERSKIEDKARKAAQAESRDEIRRIEREAKDQADTVRKLTTQLEAVERDVEVEIRKRVQGAKRQLESDIADRLDEKYRGKELEAQRRLSDAHSQIANLERKLDQTSRQMQGDVSEGRLVDILSRAFPGDDVQSVSKRVGGADVLQRVCSQNQEECGAIVWESKNTAQWSAAWLPKLRHDQRRVKAEIAVLVSVARPPKGCGRLEFVDGVWVTDLALAVGLATVLRSHLVQVKQYKDVTPATAEKYAVIQRYLGSTEFRQRIEAMVEAFQTMQKDLATEKRSVERNWAQREKQLQMVIENVSGMYGELRAIAGPTLARVRRLELPGS
jgi:hypothetical protein